mmetsp:Transcript_40813/g.93985  ORF Transcript_40813/g.93985 Transcript_40813/m.93985 type:complete len:428 (+) Transcript_40813:124-1407(+)
MSVGEEVSPLALAEPEIAAKKDSVPGAVASPTDVSKERAFNVDAPPFIPQGSVSSKPLASPCPGVDNRVSAPDELETGLRNIEVASQLLPEHRAGPAQLPMAQMPEPCRPGIQQANLQFLMPNGQRPLNALPDAGSRRPPAFTPLQPMNSVLATVPPATACACAAGPFPPQRGCAMGGSAPPLGAPAIGASGRDILQDVWPTPGPDSPPMLTSPARSEPPPLPPHFLEPAIHKVPDPPSSRPSGLAVDLRFAASRGSFLQYRAALGPVPPPREIARRYRLIDPENQSSQPTRSVRGTTASGPTPGQSPPAASSAGDNGAGRVLLQLAKGQVSKEQANGTLPGIQQGEELLSILRGGSNGGDSDGKVQGAQLLNMIKTKGGEPAPKSASSEEKSPPRVAQQGWGRDWPKHSRADMWGSKGGWAAVHAK